MLSNSASFLILALAAAPAAAQIETAGIPAAYFADLAPSGVPIEFVQPPDVAAYLADDEARGPQGPLRYGALLDVDIDPETHGVWDRLEDGTLVWRVRILSPGAQSLGLELDEFRLPDGAQLFVYDERLESVHGALTAADNQPHGQLQLAPVRGDRLVLEYVQPPTVVGAARLSIGTVIYDYRDVLARGRGDARAGGQGTSDGAEGGCQQFLVNCGPEADPYENEQRSIVRTLTDGFLCSGALLNNTSQDGTGYVLTSWFCELGATTVFRFNDEALECSAFGPTTNWVHVHGCTDLASDQETGSRLVRLNTPVPTNAGPYYAGWSRTPSSPTEGMSMHHYLGQSKSISLAPGGATKAAPLVTGIGAVKSWKASMIGRMGGGSSGGPFFNQNERVVGTYVVGATDPCDPERFFGRLAEFWDNASLAQYLDPLGLGVVGFSGFDPLNPSGGPGGTVPQIEATDPPTVAPVSSGATVTIAVVGSGFEGVTEVQAGQSLGVAPVPFEVISDFLLVIEPDGPFVVGQLTIRLVEGSSSDTIQIPVTYDTEPALVLLTSPGGYITSSPIKLFIGAQAGDVAFLLASTTLAPTVVPGILDAAIGNGLTDLYGVGVFSVDPTTGWRLVEIPFSGLPNLTQLYFQAGVLEAANPVLPLVMSNVAQGTISL